MNLQLSFDLDPNAPYAPGTHNTTGSASNSRRSSRAPVPSTQFSGLILTENPNAPAQARRASNSKSSKARASGEYDGLEGDSPGSASSSFAAGMRRIQSSPSSLAHSKS